MEVDEILELMEGLIHHIFKGALGKDIQIPFQRLTWDDAMDRFGSDKPDLRFGMELKNVSEAVQGCTFQVFNNVIANGGQVKCINVKGYADIPRRQLDELVKFCGIYGAKGMAWLQFPAEGGVNPPSLNSSAMKTSKQSKKLLKLKQVTCCSSLPINRL